MNKLTISTYAKEKGGRVSLLFLLFLLAIYEFVTAGFSAFAIICCIPIIIIVVLGTFQRQMGVFWALIIVNFFIMWHGMPSLPIPVSIPNELLQILLLVLAIINIKDTKFERCGNLMFVTLIVWCGFITLEVLNDTCGIGIDVASWYATARSLAFQLMYIFLVFSIYISNPKILTKYLFLWGVLAIFASFWVWKQQKIGFTDSEFRWLMSRGRETHVLQGGTLIRYFSLYNDAANFGIGIASTAVAFLIFGITSRIKKHKIFFLITGFACTWAMFPSGTRTAIACLMAGMMAYVFLSKSFKIAIPVTAIFTFFIFILAFTNIGNGNQQIRRMRSAFDKNDA